MRRYSILLFCGIAALAAAFLIYERPVRQPSSPVLRLAYRPLALADVTPIILKESRLASSEVTVQLVPVPSPQLALQRFDAAEVDAIAGLTMEAVLQRMAALGDPGFRAFYFQADVAGNGWVSLIANRRLGNIAVADLAHKTVASLPTDQARFLVRRILEVAGVADSAIRIVDYNPATPLLGLESGEHDALFGLDPAVSRAAAAGHRVIAGGPVSEYLFASRLIPVSASVIRSTFPAEHPEAYEAFLALVGEAVALQESQPTGVREYFAKREYGALEPEVYQNLSFPTMVEPGRAEAMDALTEFVAELVEQDLLENDVNVRLLVQ